MLTHLSEAGIEHVVAIHDSWFLPELVKANTSGAESEFFEISGEGVLGDAIEYVGQEWLSGIGGVYDWFVRALTGSPYQDLATNARDCWRQRVAERRWPKFTAS